MTANSNLQACIDGFLAHQRALGRKYRSEQATLRLLARFAADREITDIGALDAGILDEFFASRPRPRARSFNQLVGIVSCWLDWTVAQQLLDRSPLRTRRRRETAQRVPFIFDLAAARHLLDAAAALPDNSRAVGRGALYHTIFSLCYGLGLRAGEACSLRVGHVDVARQLIEVRGGKFGKDRLVPFGPRIGNLLAVHLEHAGPDHETPLFSFDGRHPSHPGTASQVFHRLVIDLDLNVPVGIGTPRLHSLRHSFAVGCLTRWYRSGDDPTARLYHLSTFMGHVDPVSTAVYLTITTDLLAEANRRFETFAHPAISGMA
jgi:integrase